MGDGAGRLEHALCRGQSDPLLKAATMNEWTKPVPLDDVDTDAFRLGLRQLAGAVSVVTTGRSGERTGLTASSVTSLSVSPPTVIVCVNTSSHSYPAFLTEKRFVINVLHIEQQAAANRFAGRGGDHGESRFEGLSWSSLATGAPALDGALANIDVELDEVIERHGHGILIGRVKAVRVDPEAQSLIYWRGGYKTPVDV